MTPVRPSLRVEKRLLAEGRVTVIGMDEVGRGAIAGPVGVGVAAVTIDVGRVPQGLADSKLLSATRRTDLVPVVTRWARTAVGMASAEYVDRQGIVPALGAAGAQALESLGNLNDLSEYEERQGRAMLEHARKSLRELCGDDTQALDWQTRGDWDDIIERSVELREAKRRNAAARASIVGPGLRMSIAERRGSF